MTTTTGRTFTLTLPMPEPVLFPNARPHWSVRAKAVKAYRGLCGVLARVARYGEREAFGDFDRPMAHARLSLRFVFCRRRRTDPDNALAAFKSGLDGLVDAGILAGDGFGQIQLAGVTLVRCGCGGLQRCGNDRVEVKLEEVL